MPFQKLTVSFAGRTERQQAELLLEQFNRVPAGPVSVTFGANVDQWADCMAYNADKTRPLAMGSGATGQAKVMQELINLLNDPVNAALKERVNFLPLVTAGVSNFCVGFSNLFHGRLNARPVATGEQIEPLVADMRTRLAAAETIYGLSNQHTETLHDLQVGGGAQDTRAARALAEQFRLQIGAMLEAGGFRGAGVELGAGVEAFAGVSAVADSPEPVPGTPGSDAGAALLRR